MTRVSLKVKLTARKPTCAGCATKWAWLRPRMPTPFRRPRRVPCASAGRPGWRCHRTGRGWSRRSPNSTKSAPSTSARSGNWTPQGKQPARRLTRGAKGESSPEFTADGDLLFVAARPTEDDDKPPAALWRLPAAGGEAVEELALPGGIDAVRTRACRGGHRGRRAANAFRRRAPTTTSDCGTLRKDNKIIGGRAHRLSGAALGHGPRTRPRRTCWHVGGPRDLTPRPGDALGDADFDVSPDGTFVVTSWQ